MRGVVSYPGLAILGKWFTPSLPSLPLVSLIVPKSE